MDMIIAGLLFGVGFGITYTVVAWLMYKLLSLAG